MRWVPTGLYQGDDERGLAPQVPGAAGATAAQCRVPLRVEEEQGTAVRAVPQQNAPVPSPFKDGAKLSFGPSVDRWVVWVAPSNPPPTQGCIRREGTSEAAPEAVRQAVGGEVAKAVGGGYCRLQMALSLALALTGTVAGQRPGALEWGGGGYLPPFQCIPAPTPPPVGLSC